MKIVIIYNRDSKRVINLFGIPNQEKIGLATINKIADGLRKGGHQVKAIEGDKDLIDNLEHFMPRVVKGELPGLVFNVSYGIQGQARYTHVPSILEMVGIPYVGSGPLAHSLALDKVVAKMIFIQNKIPTPEFYVATSLDMDLPEMLYPLIVKPKNEAVSFGIKIVKDRNELQEGLKVIFDKFRQPALVEKYIQGREINIGIIGNFPPETLPPVELLFGRKGPKIYTYEDKKKASGREISWSCPAKLDKNLLIEANKMAINAFNALGCYDCARVDIRIDKNNKLHLLEINSLPSLGEHGSYTIAAQKAGLDFDKLVCRLVDVASARYFGTPSPPQITNLDKDNKNKVFSYLVEHRDNIEKKIQSWTNISSRTSDSIGLKDAANRLAKFCIEAGLEKMPNLSNEQTVWTWQTKAGLKNGILLIGHLDIPIDFLAQSQHFRRDPEWLYGEGIGSSRTPLVIMQYALRALRSYKLLRDIPMGLLYYADEGNSCSSSVETIQKAINEASKIIVLRPGNTENNLIIQRRGWRLYRFTATGDERRLGKIYKRRGVLRWAMSSIDEMSRLTSKKDRIAVAAGELKTESYPHLLPHRIKSTIFISYIDAQKADKYEAKIKKIIKTKDFKYSFEKIYDRPPMKKTRPNEKLFNEIKKIADEWEIPLDYDLSLSPSVGGLVPPSKPVICGMGPIAVNVDTPHEAVQRISIMQRTLLLAQYLLTQSKKK